MLIKLYAAEISSTKFYAFAPGLIDTQMQDYLCEIVDQVKFPSAARIASSRGTDNMPRPELAASTLARAISELDN